MLDDDQFSVTAQSAAAVHHFAGRARQHRLPGAAFDSDAFLICTFAKPVEQACPARAIPRSVLRRRTAFPSARVCGSLTPVGGVARRCGGDRRRGRR